MPQISARHFAHIVGKTYSDVINPLVNQYPAPVTANELVLRSKLPTIAGATTTGATAYFVYMGKTTRRISPQKVLFHVSTAGAGTQDIGTVGVFSSPTAPNRAAQTLTCLMTGTIGDLTGTGVLGNSTAFSTNVSAGIHMWAGYVVDMQTTEPTVVGLTQDHSNGEILSLASQTAFVAGSTYAGGLITAAITWQCPNLLLHIA